MNARTLSIVSVAALLAACPSHDEAKKPDDEGPAEDETGQHAQPAPAPGPECAAPPCAE